MASGDEGRGADAGRALACGVGRRVGWCAWLGRVRCARRKKEKGHAVQLRASVGRGKKEKAGPVLG